jgi:anaerobic selenocysteine-containing dehydrogenase
MNAGAKLSMPQQQLTERALNDLELLVVHVFEMSATALHADYVMASKLAFEVPTVTLLAEQICKIHDGYGWPEPYAAYQPALVYPRQGSM